MKKDQSPTVCESYEKIAAWFDEHRSKDLMEKEYLDLIIQSIPSRGTILDLGCGTGEPLAKFFIERGYQVTGIDGSQKMIDFCQKRFSNGHFFVKDMRGLNLAQKFDAVIAWDSFFHLNHEDQRSMFPIFEAHIKPSGILVFTGGPQEGEVWSNNGGENLYHASLSTDEYTQLLRRHHFEVIAHKIEDPNCGDHTVWVARAVGNSVPQL